MHSKPQKASQLSLSWQLLWQRYPKERAGLVGLQERLSYRFRDQTLLFEALTHRSAINAQSRLPWNERLEFLGDAVLGLVISSTLWQRPERFSEGELSRLRASIVNAQSLATVAKSIELGDSVLLGKGERNTGGRDRQALLADTMEAVIGAVYLDGGLEAATPVVQGLFAEALKQLSANDRDDFKTRLQEWAQDLYHQTPHYILLGESGPDHAKEFEVAVCVGENTLARGRGNSKKLASQHAAREAFSQVLLSQEQVSPAEKIAQKV